MSLEKIHRKVKEIDEQILELKNQRFLAEQEEQIESYFSRQDLIGKCFKDNIEQTYYKIIDMVISNHYRCSVLKFTDCDFDITEMIKKNLYLTCFSPEIISLGSREIVMETEMIGDLLTNTIEISTQEFEEKCLQQIKYNLKIVDYLKELRKKDILSIMHNQNL